MKNQVRFEYRLKGSGSAEGSFALADKSFAFELGNVSNPLADLLNGLVGMILEPSHIWGDDNAAWVEWYGRSSAWRWLLSTSDGQHLHVTINQSTDMFEDTASRNVLEGECLFDGFMVAVVAELDALIKHTGLLNYAQQWQKDEFPLTNFLFLKKQLVDKGIWPQTSLPDENLRLETNLLLL
ncbi:MAG: hypothetical protein QM786_16755 [Breznakibacter sp.]